MNQIPNSLKWWVSALLALWIPVMLDEYGVENTLWLCEIGNILLLPAIWTESALLVSALLVGLMLVDLAWSVDLLMALLTGSHPFGATYNMFDTEIPMLVRIGSLYHLVVPVLLVFAVRRLGFDRRGILLQTAITAGTLTMSFLWTSPSSNVNWVWGPGFTTPQNTFSPVAYLFFCMVAYPVLLYLPVHVIALRLTGQSIIQNGAQHANSL